jgi:hypothetical protein
VQFNPTSILCVFFFRTSRAAWRSVTSKSENAITADRGTIPNHPNARGIADQRVINATTEQGSHELWRNPRDYAREDGTER